MLFVKKMLNQAKEAFWLSKFVMKYGVMLANVVMLAALVVSICDNTLANYMAETGVLLFAESIIAGILIDVIALRLGLR